MKVFRRMAWVACIWAAMYGYGAGQGFSPYAAPVTEHGIQLGNPWAGGLNAPQLSAADFNNDGVPDLYLFDREGNVHLTFIAVQAEGQIRYVFNPAYAAAMPRLDSWVMLRDYNGDGIMDIFAYSDLIGIDGMCVYTGFYRNDTLQFNRFKHTGPFNLASFPLRGSIMTPIYITRADYPAIDDVDCDGDQDLLTFNLAGGYCEFYRNQSVERGFGKDSLIFTLDDNCWGGFYESGVTEKVDLAPAAGACFRASADADLTLNFRHAGSTLLTLDMDGDGDKEIILGDVSFSNLNLLTNGGNCAGAWMNQQDNLFPSNDVPVNLSIFPAAFHLDLDQDGRNDLAVAPNARFGSENREVLWHYRNEGTAEKPRFVLKQRDYLVGDMIDIGTGANPAFADVNGDGLLDLVVGNQSLFHLDNDRDTRMLLYLNTGTSRQPHFTLEDEDWLGFSRFANVAFGFTPAFGDLDQDGDLDLLVGEEAGRLFFLENQAGAGQPMRFGAVVFPYLNIDVGLASTPHIADVDGDGLEDILVGERTGNVNFFRNTGVRGNPVFDPNPGNPPNTAFFGGIDTRQPGYVAGFSAPALITVGDSLLVLTGSEDIGLQLFRGRRSDLGAIFTQSALPVPQSILGFNSRPALADIDNDGFLELAIGNNRGGMLLFKTPFQTGTTTAVRGQAKDLMRLDVFPNPARGTFQIRFPEALVHPRSVLQLIDVQGRLVRQWADPVAEAPLELHGLSSGWYAVRLIAGEKTYISRLMVY